MVDCNNHRIQKFDFDGSYLLQFGKYGFNDGELSHPVEITPYDKVFVVDQHNCRISVFQCDDQFTHVIGSGQFECPTDVATTDNK